MEKQLKNIIFAGLGLFKLTKDKAEELIRKIVDEGKLAEPDARALVERIIGVSKEKTKEIKTAITAEVNDVAKRVEKATRPPRKPRKTKTEKAPAAEEDTKKTKRRRQSREK